MTMHGYYVRRKDGQLIRWPEHSCDRVVCVQPSYDRFLLFSEGGSFLVPFEDSYPGAYEIIGWVPDGVWFRIVERALRTGHQAPPRRKAWMQDPVPPKET